MVLVEMPSCVALMDANVFAVSLAQAIEWLLSVREKSLEVCLYHTSCSAAPQARGRHGKNGNYGRYGKYAVAIPPMLPILPIVPMLSGEHAERRKLALQHRLRAVVAHPLLDHGGVDGTEIHAHLQ